MPGLTPQLRTTSSELGLDDADGGQQRRSGIHDGTTTSSTRGWTSSTSRSEQLLGGNYKFTATGIQRDWKNFVNCVLPGATWTPMPYTNPMTNQSMTLYKWANPSTSPEARASGTSTRSATCSPRGGTVLEPRDAYRKYRGLMLVLPAGAAATGGRRRCPTSTRKTKGTVNNDGFAGSRQHASSRTPNTRLVNTDGYCTYDRTHEVKVVRRLPDPEDRGVGQRLLPRG